MTVRLMIEPLTALMLRISLTAYGFATASL